MSEWGLGFRDSISGVGTYRGTSLIRNSAPLGPYSRTMPRALGVSALSYERNIPVVDSGQATQRSTKGFLNRP